MKVFWRVCGMFDDEERKGRRTMKLGRRLCLPLVFLMLFGAAFLAQAQEPIREELEVPAKGKTAPGAKMSAEQLNQLKAWSSSLAVQAATYGAPLVAMYNLRASFVLGLRPKAPANSIWRFEDISTPQASAGSGYVSPNADVVYGFGFIDLAPEPIVLTAPDSGGRYYMIELVDMWTNAFAYPAGGAAGYEGGTFVLVGPGYKGALPGGVKRIDCPTRWVAIQPRVFVKNEADLENARKVLDGIKLRGLSSFKGGDSQSPQPYHGYEEPKLNPKVASSHLPFEDPLQFWSIFSSAMNENPPPKDEVEAVLPLYRYLGIELGKQWKPENVNPIVLEEMKKAAQDIPGLAIATMTLAGRLSNGWVIPPAATGSAKTDYLTRLCVAVFGLTSNSTSEAISYSGLLDGNGQLMTGIKKYTFTLKEPMDYAKPVPPGFWSVTIYDRATGYTVSNPINRYKLGGGDDLKRNADGSITLYLQHDNPGPDKESNWIPAPAGQFYLVLRNYAPPPQLVKQLENLNSFEGPPPVLPVQ
jgi:hypothetical protein